MKYIYRYRPLNIFKDCNDKTHCYLFDELNQHYFYLTTANNENDIYEGKPIFYLKGSYNQWIGVLRYYYYFLIKSLTDDSKPLTYTKILKLNKNNKFLKDKKIREILNKIISHKIYLPKLEFIFYGIMFIFIEYIDKSFGISQKTINISKNVKKDNAFFNLIIKLINADSYNDKMNLFIDKAYYHMTTTNSDELNKYLDIIDKFIQSLTCISTPNTAIVSFSTNPTNDTMWANYANRYDGICLQYRVSNGNKLLVDKGQEKLYKVNYHKVNTYNLFNYINPNIPKIKTMFKELYLGHQLRYNDNTHTNNCYKEMRIDSFTTKSGYWNKENEYREILFNPKHLEQKYNLKSLTGIILGSRISLRNERHILRILLNDCNNNKDQLNGLKIYKIYRNKNGNIKIGLLLKYNSKIDQFE